MSEPITENSNPKTEKRVVTAETFKPNAVLINRHDSSRTAKVIEARKRDNKFVGFWVKFNTGQFGMLKKFDLESPKCPWVLRGTPIEQPEPEIEVEPKVLDDGDTIWLPKDKLTTADGVQAEIKATEPPFVHATVEDRDVIMTEDEAKDFPLSSDVLAEEENATREEIIFEYEAGHTGQAIALYRALYEDYRHADAADIEKAIGRLIQMQIRDNDAAKIKQLQNELDAANKLIVSQADQIEKLTDSRDSAIDDSAAGGDRVEELENSLQAACQEIEDFRKQNRELTEQLADAKLSNETLRGRLGAPIPMTAPNGVALQRIPQTDTLIQWLPDYRPELLAKANEELAEKLADNWEILNFTVNTVVAHNPERKTDQTEHHRIVTFVRTVDAAPPAPEPPRGAVQAIPGTHTVTQVVEETYSQRAEDDFTEVLKVGERVFNQALQQGMSRLPPTSLLLGLPARRVQS